MQPGCTQFQQACTQAGDDFLAEVPDRLEVFAITFKPLAYPARDFSTTGIRETCQLMVIGNRHNARDNRDADALLFTTVDKTQVGIRIVEILGDRAVRTGIHLAFEVSEIPGRVGRLRVVFRVGGDFDMKMFAGLCADKTDQLIGITKFTGFHHAGRHVTAQGDDMMDALFTVSGQHVAYVVTG